MNSSLTTFSAELDAAGISPVEIRRYSPEFQDIWDRCVATAFNSHILFFRNFMEYHSERFSDYSLLCMRADKLIGIFPGNALDGVLYSHQGLTFGGLVCGPDIYAEDIMRFYAALSVYLKQQGFSAAEIKPVPSQYCSTPCGAEDYALWRAGAHITERHLSTGISFSSTFPPMTELRRRGIKKAKKAGISIESSEDFNTFHSMLSKTLQRHHTMPVHTVEDLFLLKKRFPHTICLKTAKLDGEILAGVLLFLTPVAAHTQYITSSELGRKLGALDLLMQTLIEENHTVRQYFCFGISTEGNGTICNFGLLHQKEGFGGRAFLHNKYLLYV